MIISKKLNEQSDTATCQNSKGSTQSAKAEADYQRVDVNSTRTSQSRSIDGEYATVAALKTSHASWKTGKVGILLCVGQL